MDEATILGCFAKAKRAEVALEETAVEWRAWVESDPYPSRVESHGAEHLIYYDFSVPAPPHFAVRIGEIAHDLRSALDHLAWREALEHLGREPTRDEAKEIAFPICERRRSFERSSVREYVSTDAWAAMERHQPFRDETPKRPHALALLHWINRMDKHRFLHSNEVVIFRFNPLKYVTFGQGARLLAATPRREILGRSSGGDTHVATIVFEDGGTPDPAVSVVGTPPFSPTFGHPPSHLGGLDMGDTVGTVRAVFEDFAALVPPEERGRLL